MTTHPLSGAALKLECLTKSYSFMTFGKQAFGLSPQMMDCNSEFKVDTQTKGFPKKMRVNIDSANSTESEFTVLSPEHDSPPQNMKRPVDHGETPKTQPGETPPGCASMVPLHKLNCRLTKLRGFPNENRISAVIQSTEVTFCGLKWLPLLLPYWMYIAVVFNFWFSSGLIQICFVSFIGAAPDKHHGSPCQNCQTNSGKSLDIGSLHCFRGVCLKMRGPIFQRNAGNFFWKTPHLDRLDLNLKCYLYRGHPKVVTKSITNTCLLRCNYHTRFRVIDMEHYC